jgi:tetratricopeptide (TPR) repeat protein
MQPLGGGQAAAPGLTSMSLIELLIAKATQEPEAESPAPPEAEPFDWSQVFSLLTEPRPAGFGEVLVTEAWPQPEQEAREEGEKARSLRLELKLLGLGRSYPLFRYDARHEAFYDQSEHAREQAGEALVDPYTGLAAAFAGQDFSQIPYHRGRARSYSYGCEANLELGRAYLAIGRRKSALAAFKAATRSDPHDSIPWWYLGLATLFSRANRDAAKAFRASLDLRPGDADSGVGLGLSLYHSKDYAAAADQFRPEAGRGARGAWARSFLACSYRMEQRWTEARLELASLAHEPRAGWREMARQCLACVERGEAFQEKGARLRSPEMWKKLAAGLPLVVVFLYGQIEQHLKKHWGPVSLLPWLAVAAVLGALLHRLRRKGARVEQLGSGIPGLPCWQLTTWLRPRRPEL